MNAPSPSFNKVGTTRNRRGGGVFYRVDRFGGAKPRLLRRDKEAPLRVNPEQAQGYRPGSRRVDLSQRFPSSFKAF
jgi:hypothetical protein